MALKLILLLCTLVSITAQTNQIIPYDLVDNITIDCGSSGNNTADDKRPWNGDINSKFFPSEAQNGLSSATKVVGESMIDTPTVPYETARISSNEFKYIIPVTPGPKFIRLYFYSANYDRTFNNSDSFFSVKAQNYTLLSNFSVSLAAGALGDKAVKKEYVVFVDRTDLAITFAPVSNSFAFVNGIEVVSMPDHLYHLPAAEEGELISLVGQTGSYSLATEAAFEMMYRIDIGGLTNPDKANMFRFWDSDDNYRTIEGCSVVPVPDQGADIKFKDNNASYAAPETVYSNARSMGMANTCNARGYNLTWEFSVDPGFSYLVRLHYCEIESVVTHIGDRVFNVYIRDTIVERTMDVISQCGGQYVPCFKDYVVVIPRSGQKRFNLSVAIGAQQDDHMTKYIDAILNGVEIFKISDFSRNLAGSNPDPINTITTTRETSSKKSNTAIIAVAVGVSAGVILLLILGIFAVRRRRQVKDSSTEVTTWWGPISFATTKSTKTRGSTSLPSDLCRYFSLSEIKTATNNFEDIFVIGVGGFGNVYKGYIDNGSTPVAIKRLKSESSQGAREFKTEIEMLSHLRHRHLVSLIGYCDDHGEMILVYEYMARGTLRDHLYKTENPPLPWKTRLEICIGAARGLHYLHTGAKNTIIHRDVKTTNILLDEKWVAKVSDFGLSKMGSTSVSKAHVTTVVKGSIGYLDPEYYRRQQLSEKSDVYSFGVVLCEVLSGRPPILRNAEKRQVSLADWARTCHQSGALDQIVDPYLTAKIAPECLKKFGEIAVNCMVDNGTERPSMNDVVWGLEFALQLQQSAEDNDSVGGAMIVMGKINEEEMGLVNNSKSDGSFSCSWDDMSDMMRSTGVTKISSSENGTTTNESMKVFSEIYDPKGR